jgi:Peptidase M15
VSPAILTQAQTTQRLRSIGFRIRSTGELHQAVEAFKTGWHGLGPELLVDGKATAAVGPRTSAALDLSYHRMQAGHTSMSPHFSFNETKCHCGGHFSSCRRIWPTRASVVHLETLRAARYPDGLAPVSWCRCTGHNQAVGGATSSRHLKGDAVDVPHRYTLSQVRNLHLYTGIGVEHSDAHVSHVDNRPGSTSNPVVWYYGG